MVTLLNHIWLNDVRRRWCILYCSCLWTVILLARPFWDVPKQFDMTLRHTNRLRSRAVHGGRADHHPSRTCEISRTFTNQNRRQLSERTNTLPVMTGDEVCKLGWPRKQATNPIQIRECVAGLMVYLDVFVEVLYGSPKDFSLFLTKILLLYMF